MIRKSLLTQNTFPQQNIVCPDIFVPGIVKPGLTEGTGNGFTVSWVPELQQWCWTSRCQPDWGLYGWNSGLCPWPCSTLMKTHGPDIFSFPSRSTLHLLHPTLWPALVVFGVFGWCIWVALLAPCSSGFCLGLVNGEFWWDIREREGTKAGLFILPGPSLQGHLGLAMSLVWQAQPLSGGPLHMVSHGSSSSSLQVHGWSGPTKTYIFANSSSI